VPEDRELSSHVGGGNKGISPITEDGEEEGGGQPVAEERRKTDAGG